MTPFVPQRVVNKPVVRLLAALSICIIVCIVIVNWNIRIYLMLALHGHCFCELVDPTSVPNLPLPNVSDVAAMLVYHRAEYVGYIDPWGNFVPANERRQIESKGLDAFVTYIIWPVVGIIIIIILAVWVCWGWRMDRRRMRVARGLCVECGYDIRHSRRRCPECGAASKAADPAGASPAAGD